MNYKILLLFLGLSVSLNAQEVTFKWNQLQNNMTEGLINPTIVLPSAEGFFTYSFETGGNPMLPNHLFISNFSSDANLIATKKFQLPKRVLREASLVNVFESADNKHIYIISELAMKKDNSNVLYMQDFDATTKNLSDAVEIQKLTIEKLSNSGSYSVAQSEDKSKIAVLLHFPQEKDGKEKVKITVFDGLMKKLWEKEHTLNHPSEKGYKNERFFVTNTGVAVMTKIVDEFKKEPQIIVFKATENSLDEKLVSAPEFYPTEYKVTEDVSNNIYLAGYYTDNWKPTVSMGGRKEKGVFVYSVTNGALHSKNLWTDKLRKEYMGNFIGLKLLDLYMDNGDFFLIGDVQDVAEEMDKTPGSFKINYTYRTGPAVVAKVTSKGELLSAVYKYEEAKYQNRMGKLTSFYPIRKDGKVFLIASDNEATLRGKKLVVGSEVYWKAVTHTSFNDDGSITVNPIFDSGTGGKQGVTWLSPSTTRQAAGSKYYVYALGNSYHAFGTMTIN